MEPLSAIVIAAALVGPTVPTVEAAEAVVAETDRASARDFDERTRLSRTFPNELYRLYGSESAASGQWGDALRQFRHAARYADKYSQHRISLMYWHGVGVQRDRALAYAWADLAAERLYPTFAVLREKMWLDLDDAERERALREGVALYAEFGDQVAKPRLAAAIARHRSQITGSHVGYHDGRLQVMAAGPAAASAFDMMGGYDLRPMYAAWRMDADRYWAVEDAIWKYGSVEVGPAVPAKRRKDD
ncbi:MAG TPA: hypothetical protein VGD42_15340 [Lysobacter sp.]